MYVKFRVKDSNNKIVIDYFSDGYMCFMPLKNHYHYMSAGNSISIEYKLTNSAFSKEQIVRFNDFCNSIGLEAYLSFKGDNPIFHFNATKGQDNYIYILSNLAARRYLEERPFPAVVELFFELCDKYPEVDSFYLFQLAHYYDKNKNDKYNDQSFNTNHAFLSDYSNIYSGGNLRNLCTVENFQKNIKAHEVLYPIGLDLMIKNSQREDSDFLKKDCSMSDFQKYFESKEKLQELISKLTPA